MATQNPIEMEGTFPLPEAQLDRFMLRIALGYPDIEEEEQILLRFHGAGPAIVEPVITVEELLEVQELVPLVRVEASVRRYVLEVARATRSHASLEVGASPRAALFLYKAVQSLAAIRGRHYALPDDVKELADPVLAHRLVPTPQARLRGHSAEEAVRDVLESVPVPVVA
jgi:MoxR-like ATPase